MNTQPTTAELAGAVNGELGARVSFGERIRAARAAHGSLVFAFTFAGLNTAMNSRFPARQPAFWYLVPSLDVVAVLLVIAFFAAFGRPLSRLLRAVLVALFVFARVLRIADGVEMSAFSRTFNVVGDSPLLIEFVRLLRTTVPPIRFVFACTVFFGLLVGFGFWVERALRVAEVELKKPSTVRWFSLSVGVFALVSPFEWQAPLDKVSPFKSEEDRRLSGAFGNSIFARVASELDFAANIYGYRADKMRDIAQQEQRLATLPNDLKKLGGQNVYLFIIESYGECVTERPVLSRRVLPEYERFERDLSEKGFQIATRTLDSSTYGGRSWLAHATISTGVRTTDQFQLELLRVTQPTSLAQVFAGAGYRTVLVQPATQREGPLKDFHHFEAHYYLRHFDYKGPKFGWSTMPDQFVLDFVRRREFSAPKQPLFLEYALTSSHTPWSDLPPLVGDWGALGNGAIYQRERGTHFENGWLALGGAADAYAQTVVYDLEALRRYIGEFITDDSLIIILGDHQPHTEVTDGNPATGVPVHVLSKNSALLEPFRARGYVPGMRAQNGGSRRGLETLMTDLVSDFSITRIPGKG